MNWSKQLLTMLLAVVLILPHCSDKGTESEPNSPPQITSLSIVNESGVSVAPSQLSTIRAESRLTFTVTATDPDAGDSLRYSWTASVGTLDNSANPSVEWTAPGNDASGQVIVTVSDGQLSVKDTLSISVFRRAFLSSGAVTPASGNVSETYTYSATFTDPMGQAPSAAKITVDGEEHSLSKVSGTYDGGAVYQYESSLEAGSHSFRFTFTDADDSALVYPENGYDIGPSVVAEPDVEIAPEVAVIDDLDSISVSGLTDDQITFTVEGTPPQFVAGDILVSADTTNPYLRKVTSVTYSGSEISIQTTDAALNEAIKNGSLDTTFTFEISPDKLGSSRLSTATAIDGVTIIDGGLSFDNVELFSGQIGDAIATAIISQGEIRFEPSLNFNPVFEDNRLTELTGTATGTLVMSCDVEVATDGPIVDYSPEPIMLWSGSHIEFQMLGYIPVWEEFTLSFVAGMEVSAEVSGEITYGFQNTSTVTIGVQYQNEDWSIIDSFSNKFEEHPLEWPEAATVHARVWVRPVLEIKVYSAVGPYMYVEPYIAFDGVVTFDPSCYWRLYAGIDGVIGVEAEIFDQQLADYDTEMFSEEATIAEGDCDSGHETGTVTDIDGNVYQTIKIGDQWWMAENLKVTHYGNGDPIPNVTDATEWVNLSTGAYCNYNNDINVVATYGRLYNWYAVNDSRSIAPAGWHVPTDEEWKQLEMYLGMSQAEADAVGRRGTDEGGKLKEAGTTHWLSPNTGATNESGFTALPGGYRNYDGLFGDMGSSAYFWSSTENGSFDAWNRDLNSTDSQVHRYSRDKRRGFSVRCVRD